MAFSLQQMKTLYPEDPLRQGLISKFLEGSESGVLSRISFIESKDALGYNYVVQDSLGLVGGRSLNAQYPVSAPRQSPGRETLVIMGGKIQTDNVYLDAKGDAARQSQITARITALGKFFDKTFFNGNPAADINQFLGLRLRAERDAKVSYPAGANGGALTQDLLDEALDQVAGDNANKVIFCSRQMRRIITRLARGAAKATNLNDVQTQLPAYNGAPIVTISEDEAYQPILGFSETRGGSNATGSIYIVRFGGTADNEFVQAIMGPSFMAVRPPVQQGEYVQDTIDTVVGLGVFSPYSYWRIGGILNA